MRNLGGSTYDIKQIYLNQFLPKCVLIEGCVSSRRPKLLGKCAFLLSLLKGLGKITLRMIENSQVESESTLFIKIYANVTTYPLLHVRMRTYDWVLLGHMFLFEMPLNIQHSTPSSIPP